jgi:hypothetical protein
MDATRPSWYLLVAGVEREPFAGTIRFCGTTSPAPYFASYASIIPGTILMPMIKPRRLVSGQRVNRPLVRLGLNAN